MRTPAGWVCLPAKTAQRVGQALTASPRHETWPQLQRTSVFSATDSQCGLQYLLPSVVVQLQAGFAHFLRFAIVLPSLSRWFVRLG